MYVCMYVCTYIYIYIYIHDGPQLLQWGRGVGCNILGTIMTLNLESSECMLQSKTVKRVVAPVPGINKYMHMQPYVHDSSWVTCNIKLRLSILGDLI